MTTIDIGKYRPDVRPVLCLQVLQEPPDFHCSPTRSETEL